MADRVIVLLDRIPEVSEHLHVALAKIIKTAAFNIEARAKNEAVVDTGAMRAAIYTVTRNSSGYSSAAAQAESLQPGAPMQTEVPPPEKDTSAVVHAGMNYSVYVEYGTTKMAAQPFIAPAVAAEQPNFQQAIRRLAGELSA
jgi:HK97 gp10 family phage protein